MWIEKRADAEGKTISTVGSASSEQTFSEPCGLKRPRGDSGSSERGVSALGTSLSKKSRIITNGLGSPDFNSVSRVVAQLILSSS